MYAVLKVRPSIKDAMDLRKCGEMEMFLDSSMVEHSAVNRRVVGSSPTGGATKGEPPSVKVAAHFFYIAA